MKINREMHVFNHIRSGVTDELLAMIHSSSTPVGTMRQAFRFARMGLELRG